MVGPDVAPPAKTPRVSFERAANSVLDCVRLPNVDVLPLVENDA